MNPVKLALDAAAGVALAFLLLLVIVVNVFTRPSEVKANNDLKVEIVTGDAKQTGEKKKLKLAVVPTERELDKSTGLMVAWDDMSKLLGELGKGYSFDEIRPVDMLAEPNRLDQYDVLFLTCAPKRENLRDLLVKFVSRGGILYASDWRYDDVADAFPDVADPATRGEGVRGSVEAQVVDKHLQEVLGRQSLALNFDLPRWKTAAFKGDRVTVLMEGNYRKMRDRFDNVGEPARAPLLVKFPMGKGQVIFTSFHNEKQNKDEETKLLKYLVFTMVTADIDAQVQSSITQGGFAPQRSNLLSTPDRSLKMTKTFRNSKVGALRFALGFRDEGARLKLYLRSPDGKDFSWEGGSTVILEVPNAAAGEWTYTISAVGELPYENFPFTVTVGEKK